MRTVQYQSVLVVWTIINNMNLKSYLKGDTIAWTRRHSEYKRIVVVGTVTFGRSQTISNYEPTILAELVSL